MQPLARRIIAALEVSRLPVAFGAIANVWIVVLLARLDPALSEAPAATLPEPVALVAAMLVAVGFLVFGAALNDFLDAKHDRAFAPDRPLPSGALSSRRAMQIAVGALCLGLAGAAAFGFVSVALGVALTAIVLVYDAFAKHVPALGIVLAGLATAASMLAPAPETSMTVPIWLAMSQTMGVGALAYVLAEKRPKLTRRAVVAGACGWAFWSAAILGFGWWRNGGAMLPPWFAPADLVAPLATAVVCAAFMAWKVRGARGPRASDKLLRYGSLWKGLVAAAWIGAAGLHAEAAWIGGASIAIFLVFAFLREAGPQLAEPVTWRS
ncbi:MAG: UbiA family prenyltransferase [Planctomycetota bacterium]